MSADTEPTTLRLAAEDGLPGTAIAARWVGQRMPRTEDQRMITGHGRYVDDLAKPGMVHAAFVRSTVARGRIVDAGRQRGPPGAGRDRGADRGRDQHADPPVRARPGRPDAPAAAGRRRRAVRGRADRHRGGRVAVPGRGRRRAGQRGHRPAGRRWSPRRRRWPRAARGCTRSCPTTWPAWSPATDSRTWTSCLRMRRTCSPRPSTSIATCACRWRPAAWWPSGIHGPSSSS